MKNKIKLKQYFISTFIVSICLFVSFLTLNIYEYNTYTKNFNNKIGAIINVIKINFQELREKELIIILIGIDLDSIDFFSNIGFEIGRAKV